jgi:hypothetical protein
MPRGDKSAYTEKQKRQARHIEEGYEKRGVPDDEAEKRAWATVNKMTGGGKKEWFWPWPPYQHSPGAERWQKGRRCDRGPPGREALGGGEESRTDSRTGGKSAGHQENRRRRI